MNKQPKALRLADLLTGAGLATWYANEAAAELRRLHDENEALKAKLQVATKAALDHKERGDELLVVLEEAEYALDYASGDTK